MDFASLFFGIVFGFIIGFLIMRLQGFRDAKAIRRDAIRGSKSAITGEIYEKILPALPNFPYAPKDMVFVGKGIDYIIFDGISEGNIQEVIFLELKSGKSRLNHNEREIKRALDEKRVRYAEIRIGSTKSNE